MQNYYGSFLYDAYGLAGGMLTGTDFYLSGALQYAVDGLQVPALTFEHYLDNLQTRDLLALVFAGNDSFVGSSQADVFISTAGHDRYDGAGGVDALVYADSRSAYAIQASATAVSVSSAASGTDMLTDIERLQFADGILAFDISGVAGKTLRLYQAALGREPDAAGLGHNIAWMDQGMTHKEMAAAFIGSEEFQQRFSAATNEAFVQLLYVNILGREGEAAGVAHHVNLLESGYDRADLLVGFSEGQENLNRTAPLTADGIWFV